MNTEENHCYKVLNDSNCFFSSSSSSSCWLSVVCGYCLHYSCPPQTVIEMEPPCIIQKKKKKWEVLYSFGGGIAYIYSLAAAAAAGISVSVTANGADRIDRL